ncbi:MAG: hypothetical protein VYC34_05155, partial [Planctomycetota bacterium]|nr:hypothetical protein [Planctomycetota bacterium]
PPFPMPRPIDNSIGLDPQAGLRGVLTHDLPAPLEDVRMILIRRQTRYPEMSAGERAPEGGPLRAEVLAWSRGNWNPGEAWDLSTLEEYSQGRPYLQRITGDITGRAGSAWTTDLGDRARAADLLELITWAPMLEPPDYRIFSGTRVLLQRRATHTLDLGEWFTQPCLIIVGQLSDSPCPTPILVDGEPARSTGRTVIRWIYPLLPAPPAP